MCRWIGFLCHTLTCVVYCFVFSSWQSLAPFLICISLSSSQVHEKQSKSMEYRRQEVQEDKFFVDCVGEALREDRSYRMQKVADEKSLLCQSWDQQKSYNQRLKTLQQRHDGKS